MGKQHPQSSTARRSGRLSVPLMCLPCTEENKPDRPEQSATADAAEDAPTGSGDRDTGDDRAAGGGACCGLKAAARTTSEGNIIVGVAENAREACGRSGAS